METGAAEDLFGRSIRVAEIFEEIFSGKFFKAENKTARCGIGQMAASAWVRGPSS
jgi:hypothetical protein